MKTYLCDVKAMLLKEKYPGGVSHRQRILALEEKQKDLQNDGYSYFDNGYENTSQQVNGAGSPPTHPPVKSIKKIGKRLMLRESDE